MRICLAVEGTRGDVHPMLDLGAALRDRRHEVTLCASPDFREDAVARGLHFEAVGEEVRPFLAENAAAVARGGLAALRTATTWFGRSLDRQFDELPAAARAAELIVGAGVQIAGPSIAERLGVPYRYLAYCPALLPSPEYPPPALATGSLPRPLNRLSWRLFGAFLDRMLLGRLNARRAALELPAARDAFAHVLTPRPLIAADAALAPAPAECRLDSAQIGCLHVPDATPLPAKLRDFLACGPEPVYFGFGSMTDPDPAATTRLALDVAARLGVRALISQGWAGLGDGPLPGDALAVGAVSHAQLFPRCAAVVHHGGAGTTATAARAGVPQLLVPHVADQFYWAQRVFALGLGPAGLPRSRLRADRLAERLGATLDNELVAARARELAVRLSGPHPLDGDPLALLLEATGAGRPVERD